MLQAPRVVTARRGDGSTFQCEAIIRELPTMFISFFRDLTQEQQARASHRLVSDVLQLDPAAVIISDQNGCITHFNSAAERLLDYTKEEVVGRNVSIFCPPNIANLHDGYIKQYLHTGVGRVLSKSSLETTARTRAGKEIPVSIFLKEHVPSQDSVLPMPEGRYFICYIRDISEQLHANHATDFNQSLVTASPVPLLCINSKGIMVAINPAAEQTFGISQDKAVGQNITLLMPSEYAMDHDEYIETYCRTGKPHAIGSVMNVTAKRVDNSAVFPCEVSVRAVRTPGQELLFVGYVRDQTPTLLAADAKLAVDVMLNRSPVPIVAVNTKGIIVLFSDAACRAFGWERRDALGKNVKMLMPQQVARLHDQYLRSYMKTGIQTIVNTSTKRDALRKDGTQFPIQLTVREIRNRGSLAACEGGVPGDTMWVGYVQDLSQEYILSQSQKIRDVIFHYFMLPMIQADASGRILDVNRPLLDEFEYRSEQDLLGANVSTLCSPEIASQHDSFIQRYHLTKEKRLIGKTQNNFGRRSNGTIFPVEVSLREVVADGVTTFYACIRNMTERFEEQRRAFLFSTFVDVSTTPTVVSDAHGKIVLFNKAAEKMFHYTAREAVGKNVTILQSDDVAKAHPTYILEYLHSRDKKRLERSRLLKARTKEGVLFSVEGKLKEYVEKETKAIYFIAFFRDISAIDRAAQLQAALDGFVDVTPHPLVGIDSKGVITFFSRAAETEFAYAADEVVGSLCAVLQPPSLGPGYQESDSLLRSVVAAERSSNGPRGEAEPGDKSWRAVVQRNGGEQFEAIISLRRVQKENVSGSRSSISAAAAASLPPAASHSDSGLCRASFFATFYPLTQMLASSESSRLLTDLLPVAYVRINLKGIVVDTNPALVRLLGWQHEELVNANIKKIMREEDAAVHDEHLQRYIGTRQKVMLGNKTIVSALHKNGSVVPVEINVRELSCKLLEPSYFAFLRDLEPERQLQHELSLHEILSSSAVRSPMLLLDARGIVQKASIPVADLLGLDGCATLVGRPFSALMDAECIPQYEAALQSFSTTNDTSTFIEALQQAKLRRPSTGGLLLCRLQANVIAKDGAAAAMIVQFIFDTEKERIEAEAQSFAELLLANGDVGVVIIQRDGAIKHANQAAARLFEASDPAALQGANIRAFISSDAIPLPVDQGLLAAPTGARRRVAVQSLRGALVPADLSLREATFIRSESPSYVLSIADVREAVRLADTTRMTDALASLSPCSFILINNEGVVRYASATCATFFGYTSDELVGNSISMLMPQEDDAKTATLLKHSNAAAPTKTRANALHKNGSRVAVEMVVKEIAWKPDNSSAHYFLAAISVV